MAGLISNREIAQVIGLDEGTVRSDVAESRRNAPPIGTSEPARPKPRSSKLTLLN
jgi:hypothetical protein